MRTFGAILEKTTMQAEKKTYLKPVQRMTAIRFEQAFLLISTVDTADNQYNPENDLGGIE